MWTRRYQYVTTYITAHGRRGLATKVHLNNAARPAPFTPFIAADHKHPSWSLTDYSSTSSTSDSPSNSSSSSSLSKSDLAHLCSLTYLRYPESEADEAALRRDVESVIAWTGTITHVDMEKYEPMYTPLEVKEYYHACNKTNVAAHQSASSSNSSSTPSASSPSSSHPGDLRLRPDVVSDECLSSSMDRALLSNASYAQRGFFVVPKVLDMEDE